MDSFKERFLETLTLKYAAKVNAHKLAMDILMEKCVGIGEHTDFIEEANKHVSGMSEARENIQTLIYYYPEVKILKQYLKYGPHLK